MDPEALQRLAHTPSAKLRKAQIHFVDMCCAMAKY